MKYRDIMILERKIIINFHITEQQLEEFTASFIFAYATSQTQCLQGTESSFSLGGSKCQWHLFRTDRNGV